MKKFEYACLRLNWSKREKVVSITQYDTTKSFQLTSEESGYQPNQPEVFNKAMAILGVNSWELVSVSTLMGTDISMLTDVQKIKSEAQEFWFKREIPEADTQLPTIEETLTHTFDVFAAFLDDFEENDQDEDEDSLVR